MPQSESELLQIIIEGQRKQAETAQNAASQMQQLQMDFAEIKGNFNMRLVALEQWRDGVTKVLLGACTTILCGIIVALLVAIFMRGTGLQVQGATHEDRSDSTVRR